MKDFWFRVILLLLFVVSYNLHAEVRDPRSHFFQQNFGDFSEELQLAKQEGKKGLLLFFEMDECPFCHFMKNNVLNRSEVQDYFRDNFRIISVDVEGDVDIVDLQGNNTTQKEFAARQFRVRATPVTAFVDLDGNVMHRYTGKTSGIEEFMLMGKFVVEDNYKTEKFTSYKRAHRSK